MKSAWKGSQSMARACKRRFGPNGGEAGQRHGFERPAERFLLSVSLPSLHVAPYHLGWPVTGRIFVSAGHGPVAFAGPEQGPDGAGHAVGEGDGDQFQGLALQHFPQPVVTGRSSASGGDHPQSPQDTAAGGVANGCATGSSDRWRRGCPSWLFSPAFRCRRLPAASASTRSSRQRRAFSTTRRGHGRL